MVRREADEKINHCNALLSLVQNYPLSLVNHCKPLSTIVTCADQISRFSRFGRTWLCSCGRPDHLHIRGGGRCQCGVSTTSRFRFFLIDQSHLRTASLSRHIKELTSHVFFSLHICPKVRTRNQHQHKPALLSIRQHILVGTGGHSAR